MKKKSTQSLPNSTHKPTVKEMCLYVGFSYSYGKKMGRDYVEKVYLQKKALEKIIQKEEKTVELIALGVEPSQAKAISEISVDFPEKYGTIEATVEKSVKAKHVAIIRLAGFLMDEEVSLQIKTLAPEDVALLLKALNS